jgi:hypothetical protein
MRSNCVSVTISGRSRVCENTKDCILPSWIGGERFYSSQKPILSIHCVDCPPSFLSPTFLHTNFLDSESLVNFQPAGNIYLKWSGKTGQRAKKLGNWRSFSLVEPHRIPKMKKFGCLNV